MIILLIVFILGFNIQTFAYMDSSIEEIELIGISENEVNEKIESLNWREISEKQILESNSIIKSLRVAEDCILIGLEDNKIAILNLEGKYLNGFSFYTTGNYELFYNCYYNMFTIYVWRSETFYTFDKKGDLIAVEKKDIMHKDDVKYHNLECDNIDNIYLENTPKNLFFNGVKNRVVRAKADGKSEVLYEIEISLTNSTILYRIVLTGITILLSGVFICLLMMGSNQRKKIYKKVYKAIMKKTDDDIEKLKLKK